MQIIRDDGTIHYSALAGTVAGDERRSIQGIPYPSAKGYLFPDHTKELWWIIFATTAGTPAEPARPFGDVLACSDSHESAVEVRILAQNVSQHDADNAFGSDSPATYEDAARTAARIPGS